MLSKFLEENFVDNNLLKDSLEYLIQKPCDHSNDFEIVSSKNEITDLVGLFFNILIRLKF
jgi:hypothetical protein